MKKLAITQIIIGILLLASFFVYIFLVEPGYSKLEVIDGGGNVIGYWEILGLHRFNPVAAVWMFGFPVLGVATTVLGIAGLVKALRGSVGKRFAVSQIVLGGLALVMMAVFVIRVQPTWHTIPFVAGDLGLPPGTGNNGLPGDSSLRYNPSWVVLMTGWKVVSFMLGPAISACGAIQLRK